MGQKVEDAKDLIAWQRAVQLCKSVYLATGAFPKEETYGLAAQLRRAAVSIPSNLAEGCGRGTTRDYRQFVCIARGSACELETQIIIAHELGFLCETAADQMLEDTRRVIQPLHGLVRALDR